MVPIERHERAQLHPTTTQLLVCVANEPTRIRTNERNLEDLKLEHALDTEMHVLSLAEVVAEPVACPSSGAGEGTTGDDKWPLAMVKLGEDTVSCFFLHQAP